MRIRLLTLAAAAGMAVAAVPSHAAAPKPQITDPAGDANAVNNQALGVGPDSSASTGPAELAAADITGVTFQSTFKTKKVKKKVVKVPTGFTVTMALDAAPTLPNIIYRVSANGGGCGTSIFFEYTTGGSTVVRCPNADVTKPSLDYPVGAAVVKGSTITWKLSSKAIPVGSTLSTLNAQTRQQITTPAVSITAPQYDYASSGATFTVGK